MTKNRLQLLLLVLLLLLAVACATGADGDAVPAGGSDARVAQETATSKTAVEAAETGTRPAGWSSESHSSDAKPNYDVVFPQDEVKQLTITIAPEDWEAMQANMTELFGEQGTGFGPGARGGPGNLGPRGDGDPPGDFQPPADGALPDGVEPPDGAGPPANGAPPPDDGFDGRGGPGGFGGGDFAAENPMWVPATIEFEGQTWTNVGVRYKGNSSLRSSWDSGTLKLPFKLDFDEFEDDYPAIEDQRFYGFKQLSLANGFGDATYMRDTITYDLLEEAGLVAAETAYYDLFLDYGEGLTNLGIYTVIEVIDDTVVDRVFGDDAGNIYEGDGRAASLAEGTFAQLESSFQKENNKDEADYGDLEMLYQVLHSEERTTDPAAWRENMEAIFDVDTFLAWLALSAAIQHWDAYGAMSHNYYLYHDPDTGLLTWISWDHNLVLGGLAGGGPGGPGGRNNVSLDKATIGAEWPLIRYLLDQPVYYEAYTGYLADAADLLDPDKMAARYQELARLLRPYLGEGEDGQSFTAAVEQLTEFTYQRRQEVLDFLATQ